MSMSVSQFVLRNALKQAQSVAQAHEAITVAQQDFASCYPVPVAEAVQTQPLVMVVDDSLSVRKITMRTF